MLASTSRGPSPFSLQATTRALHTYTLHCHTNTYSSTRIILRGIPVSVRRKHPTELISTWGNTRRGIKPEFSKFTREILQTSNLSYGVIGGLTTGPLPLNRADTGRYRLRPYTRDRSLRLALLSVSLISMISYMVSRVSCMDL